MAGFIALLALILGVVGYAWWSYRRAKVPDDVAQLIEKHLALEGVVMFMKPVMLNFGDMPPGARQYSVDITTPLGFSRKHTVEVEQTGQVRTVL